MSRIKSLIAKLARRKARLCEGCESGQHESLVQEEAARGEQCSCACHMGNSLL
jgi:hypothetical protein